MSLLSQAQPIGFSSFSSETDPGKVSIGLLKGTIVFGTNSEDAAPKGAKALSPELVAVIEQQEKLTYSNYYYLGTDQQDIYKAYENWLKPIKKSDKIMLSYELTGKSEQGVKLGLNFWLDNRKEFSTEVPNLTDSKPSIITGNPWRGGDILVILELTSQ